MDDNTETLSKIVIGIGELEMHFKKAVRSETAWDIDWQVKRNCQYLPAIARYR